MADIKIRKDDPRTPRDRDTSGQEPGEKKPVNTLLWRILLLPSLLILAAAVGLYLLRPARDAFISGQQYNSYLLYGTYAAWSPKFLWFGLSSILFGIMLIVSIGKTVGRGEWKYWQRLLGLIALTAAGVILLIIGFPELGTDARDAGAINFDGRIYHLLAQTFPSPPNTTLRLSIFECDSGGINCARVQVDDIEYQSGDRVPALDLLRITSKGPLVITQNNTTSTSLSQYRPQ